MDPASSAVACVSPTETLYSVSRRKALALTKGAPAPAVESRPHAHQKQEQPGIRRRGPLRAAPIQPLVQVLPAAPALRTWDEALRRWLLLSQHKAGETQRREQHILEWLQPRLAGMPLAAITNAMLDELRMQKLEEGAGPRTANYVVGVVSTVLAAAVDWGWLDKAPRIKPLKLPPSRVRWLTHADAARLLAELRPPLREMADFSLETGLRWGNVAGLKWASVDLRHGLVTFNAREMKGRAGLCIPLTPRALEILHAQRGQHGQWVFTSQRKKVSRPARLNWYGALERAGIEDFRWHDLRHTWASWHAQRGTPMLILQQLGGWKSASMVTRYSHLDIRSLQEHVAGFSSWNQGRTAQIGAQAAGR